MLVFDLARPPSVNGLFANAERGRVRTTAYRRWVTRAAWEAKIAAGPTRIDGAYGVVIGLGACPGRRPDLDNIIKPIVDALVKAGVTGDDRDLAGVLAARSGCGAFAVKPDFVRVAAMPAEAFFARLGKIQNIAGEAA